MDSNGRELGARRATATGGAHAPVRTACRCIAVAVALVAAALAALALGVSPVRAAATAGETASQQLADKYSPIVMVRKQTDGICDSAEEQYSPPTSVYTVLGNPRVKLLSYVRRRTVVLVKSAPSAADVARKSEPVYLDLPGSPLSPACKYSRDFNALRKAGRAPALTYAHIAREAGRSGFVLQYWFFYYFNHFNDLHESDWEGMQIAFTADKPEEALKTEPDEIVLFQHSGGEHTDWDDSKVQKEGNHPVVYSAAGSHGTFYSPGLWLGTGQNGSGVGCDDTTKPLIRVKPKVVLLPDQEPTKGPFAWLSFRGRWGQREAGFNNGPGGASTKVVWRDPLTWMDGTRAASPQVPGGTLMGPSVADAFCGAVEQVTGFLNLATKTTPGAIGIIVGLLLVIVAPLSITRWRPVALDPLHQRRAFGQLLLVSVRMYWRYRWALMLIGLSALALLGAVAGIEFLVRSALHANGNTLSFGDSSKAITVSLPGSIGRFLATPVAEAVVIAFIMNADRCGDAGFVSAWSAVLRRVWRLLVVQLMANIAVPLLFITIIGIPYGVKKFVDWQFVQQEVLFEDRTIRQAMRSSTRVVHGHWWRTGLIAGGFWILSQIPGPALGFALLFTTVPVETVNLIGSVVFALLLPYIEIGRTLLYFDVIAREEGEQVPEVSAAAVAPATG
jgi:hypothetical protein